MNKKAFIFDLDGVIVDTAHFHFKAWKKTAEELGFDLTEELNEKLKGVSRIDSLQKILDWAKVSISKEQFDNLTCEKNEDYLAYVRQMTKDDVLPGVSAFIERLKKLGYPIALGSASKNAKHILERVDLLGMFDAIVDGNSVTKAKPDPEVFLNAAKLLKVDPVDCVVFEDSVAGIQAANIANMTSIGIGDKSILSEADHCFKDFTEINTDFLSQLIGKTITN
ncbi:MAG TPA: beta-phosphoglucomutase [Flavobacteriaceae bacterium]|jgi:beta-phosphoglucomutase